MFEFEVRVEGFLEAFPVLSSRTHACAFECSRLRDLVLVSQI